MCGVAVTGHFSRARTGASSVPDKVTFQGTGNVCCFSNLFMLQHKSPCLTYESVGVHVTFHFLCQLLPFGTYAERVNFVSFVQHLPLQILCVASLSMWSFWEKGNHKNLLYSLESLQDDDVFTFLIGFWLYFVLSGKDFILLRNALC